MKTNLVGGGDLRLVEERVKRPFKRDYDKEGEDNPSAWAKQHDIKRWGIFVAMDKGLPVGGATVALESPIFPAFSLQREDLAILWDIRVHPDHQFQGVGRSLFHFSTAWAKAQGYGQLGLETDGSNIPACKFYAKMGCNLGGILKYGYSGIPEIAEYPMLLWYIDL